MPYSRDMLAEARTAYEEHRWADAVDAYEAAGSFRKIPVDDAERLAWAIVLCFASPADCLDAFERLEGAALDAGDYAVAARAALEGCRVSAMVEDFATAGAAMRRAAEHAAHAPAEEALLVRYWPAFVAGIGGDTSAGAEIARELLPEAKAAGDVTVEALSIWTLAAADVERGALDDGTAGLDTVMSMCATGQVHPFYAALIACGVVSVYRAIGDWDRARQWTDAADRHCERESICHFPGHCAVFRSEIHRLEGDFARAAQSANDALKLSGEWATAWIGLAYHQIGEAELCLGNLAAAQTAFARAVEAGRMPQPGRARLLAATGDLPAAMSSIAQAIDGMDGLGAADQVLVLSAAVSLAVEADDLDKAKSWSRRLRLLASASPTAGAKAASEQARGELALANGDDTRAVEHLQHSVEHWNTAGAPYHAARARLALASGLARSGDRVDAEMHHEIAVATLERLGARLDLEQIREAARPRPSTHHTLSFTDIVQSSELVAALGDTVWANVLAAHDRTLRSALAEHNGREVKHEGDGLFVAFESEHDAVRWAVAVQTELAARRNDHGFAPSIRVGIHCGRAINYGPDLIGRCVHETARIANAAGADEIFVSATVAEVVADEVDVTDRKMLTLKGFDTPHEVAVIPW